MKAVPKTKAGKAAKVEKTMHEFKEGGLHSGSKQGPKVESRDQAIAIALSQAGESKSHNFQHSPSGSQGYGHDVTQRSGALRNSGHSGAHRIGKR